MRVMIFFAIVPALAWAGWATPDASPAVHAFSRPPLAFAQYAVVHGEVEPQPVVEATFRFENRSDQPATIRDLTPSCGCLRPKLHGGVETDDGTTFRPGERGEFTIFVDTANEEPGPQDYSVLIASQADGHDHFQTVRYELILPTKKLTVHPRELFFYQIQAESGQQTVTVRDPRDIPATVLDVEVAHPSVTAEIQPRDGQATKITVAVAAGLAAGRDTTQLIIHTDDQEFPVVRVPILLQGPTRPTPKERLREEPPLQNSNASKK